MDDDGIDAVITWVDGDDPAHRASLGKLLAERGGGAPSAARATRFNDAGEIDYCVASLARFAPWLRRIHIVTAGQTPSLMARIARTPLADRVRIVDHREIFAGFEDCLPTFNSRAIISALWRIRGLSDRFVFFNDDFMLLRRTEAKDFFRDDGRMVLRGRWAARSRSGLLRRILDAMKPARKDDKAGHRIAQEASAQLVGFDDRYLQQNHSPYPMRRSTLEAFFAARPGLLRENLRHPLRSSQQFKVESVAAHLEFQQGRAILDDSRKLVQLKPRQQAEWRMRARMRSAEVDGRVVFGCVQSLELATPEFQKQIIAWLHRMVGDPTMMQTVAPTELPQS